MADEAEDADVEVEETEEVETPEGVDETETEAEDEQVEAEAESSESSTEKDEPARDEVAERVQARIDELTRRYYQAERRAEALEAQIQQQPAATQPGKTLADFEYDEGKFAAYLTEQAQQTAQQQAEQTANREQEIRRQIEFESRESVFSTQVADYHAVTRDPAIPMSQAMVDAAMGSDKGPDVLYYLAKHPDEARLVAQLSPLDAAREMGRIEATKLKPPKAPEPKPVATPPKIKAKGSPEKVDPRSPNSDKLSDDEWFRRRNKQLAAKR